MKEVIEKNNSDPNTIFQQEIQKIRSRLLEKSSELVEFENRHNEIMQINKNSVKDITELQQVIVDENVKLKGIIMNLIISYKNNNETDLLNMLNYLVDNVSDFEPEKFRSTITTNSNKNTITQDDGINLKTITQENNTNILNNGNNTQFVDKVMNEFNRVLTDELKRVERFYKRTDSSTLQQKKRTSSVKEKRKSNTISSSTIDNNSISKETISELTDVSKIRASIRNINKIVDTIQIDSSRKNSDSNNNTMNNPVSRNNSLNKKNTPVKSPLRVFKKEDPVRNKFEEHLRQNIFKYKQK
jgi:hypothetical protein